MKSADLKTKSPQELQKLVLELRTKTRELRFQKASGKVKNVRDIRKTKKELAQVLTVLRQQN